MATPALDSPILIIGGGPFQRPLIDAARSTGRPVAVLDGRADAPGMALAHVPIPLNFADVDSALAAVTPLAPAAVITAGSDAALPAVVAIGAALGLVTQAPSAVAACADKLEMGRRLAAAEVPSAEGVALGAAAGGAEGGATSWPGPWPAVVKPRRGAGGRGVSVIHDLEALPAAAQRAQAGGALIQRHVGGRPLGVELMMLGGEVAGAWIMDDQLRPGFAAPVGHALPADLPEAVAARVIEIAAAAALAVGLRDGPANLDLRLEGDTPVVLEINPRLGGSGISTLIEQATGIRLCRAVVAWALGEDPRPWLRPTRAAGAASQLILARGQGRLWLPDVSSPALHLDLEDGQRAPGHVDDWSIVGRCLVTAPTGPEARRQAAALVDEVEGQIRLTPDL